MTPFKTAREIPAAVDQVFAAFIHPERLARWSLTMHGPDGTNYPNEFVFTDVEAPGKVVIQHVHEPEFRLTIALAPSAVGTLVSWAQAFESAATASRIEHIVAPANEQNRDRLVAEVLGQHAGG